MATPEGKVKAQTVRSYKKLWPTCWHYKPPGGAFGVAGVPDHIFCVPYVVRPEDVGKTIGRFVAIEDKAEKGKLTKMQVVQIDAINAAGGLAFVVRGVESCKKLFEKLERYWK